MNRTVCIAAVFSALCLAVCSCSQVEAVRVSDANIERTKWWRDARFGMFIHWGLYAVPAGQWHDTVSEHDYGEWLMFHLKVPVAEYEQVAKKFNPVKFDADEWVGLAKAAGMKYMVITSKHHDGFSMFDSKVTEYDIVDATPFGRDPMKDLAQACRKEGIKFGFYYSVDRDWHHPDAEGNTWDYPDESKKDFQKYLDEFAMVQIEELLTQYGPLGILWFDGIGKKTDAQNEAILQLMREHQPNCLVNSRLGDWKTFKWGDYRSMDDNEVPDRGLNYGWENPGTLNNSYGYNKHDHDWKSPSEVIRMLADVVSKGGNYLLNVGPKADGTIPKESVRILQAVGRWMDKYGESIYETSASPIGQPEWGRCTAKAGKLYLHVFDWPDSGELVAGGVESKAKKAYLLADAKKKPLGFAQSSNGDVVIKIQPGDVSPQALDPSDTVIVLETECAGVAKYEPTWESLKQYEVPAWFEDDKFGIFIHWGVYAVPAAGSEWYPRNMYRKGESMYKHHKQVWGDQSEFGYKDFVGMFKAERWNPDDWAELFKKSGARFVVPVAEHHDGFAMYDSAHTRWNSVKMGPQRDIVGELAEAVRKRGMKFGASTHYAFNWRYYAKSEEFDTSDARYFDLYGKNFDPDAPASEEFLEHWYARTVDIVDKYQPDILWFDFGFSGAEFEPYRKKIGAYYYNKGLEWGKGVVLQYKDVAYPYGTAVLDLERGKLGDIREMVWQTDTSISYDSWGYIENDKFKSVDKLVDDLVDIVSKNGCLLLNVGPKADGTIPTEAVDIFLGIGRWLGVNGEAIYGTRPWLIYGEGPTEAESGSFTDDSEKVFTSKDIRFTRKGDTLYAICLDWPQGNVLIRSLGKRAQPGLKISNVSIIGSRERLKWSQDRDGLAISAPKKKPCENAFAFKITIDGVAIGGLKVTQGDGDYMTARAVLEGFGRSGWRGDIGLYVDGKIVESEEISIGAGGKGKVFYKYALAGVGLHTVGIASEGHVIAAKEVVSPNIDLAGKWRFHRGDEDEWGGSDFDDSNWQDVELPASWEDHSAYRRDPAYGWYRRKVTIPAEWEGTDVVLVLGKIDDIDQTYFNGERIGGSGEFPPDFESSEFNKVRRYPVEADLIRYGQDNVIAVRVYDQGGRGGMWQGPMGPIEMAK